jgi:hypothetical protein
VILAFLTASATSVVTLPETAYGQIAYEKKELAVVADTLAETPDIGTETIVRSYFKDIPVLIEIARCESAFRHTLADGSVLRGVVDPADTGVMQINRRYHEATATAMNLNLNDVYHNLVYARHLYETQGTQPWNASMKCWGKGLVVNY